MIQRIQSLYLLAVIILLTICLFLPLGSMTMTEPYALASFKNLYILSAEGGKDFAPWALFAILALADLLAVITLFSYKRRMLQIRFSVFGIILLIAYYPTLLVFVKMLHHYGTFTPSWTLSLPIVSIILNWLAIRAIGKDEVLVNAYKRIR